MRDHRSLRQAQMDLAVEIGLDPAGFPWRPQLGADTRLRRHVRCPCCIQPVGLFHRPMTGTCAAVMIAMDRIARTKYRIPYPWLHVPTVATYHCRDLADQGGYRNLGFHWGLMEEERSLRTDTGGRAGYWRLTPFGVEWVRGREKVPKHAWIYNNHTIGLDGPMVTVWDVLPEGFNYDELMRGE
jgi:hypothetical protein